MEFNSLITILHVSCMTVSIFVMIIALMLALFRIEAAVKLSTVSYLVTIIGTGAGIILLISHPLTLQCLALFTYLAVVSVVYKICFGLGKIENSSLFSKSLSIKE